jgi:hypothetical protein
LRSLIASPSDLAQLELADEVGGVVARAQLVVEQRLAPAGGQLRRAGGLSANLR